MLAQDVESIFRDDFNSIEFSWPRGNWDYGSAKIEGGHYTVDRQARNGYWFLAAPSTFLDYTGNFEIEFRVRWISGSEKSGFGVCWGAANVNSINMAVISSSGQFMISQYESSRQHEISGWRPTAAIKVGSEYNTLTLKKRGSAINILVNGSTISSIEAPGTPGRDFGIVVWDNQQIEVDYFDVRQNQPPIKLANDHPVNVQRELLGSNVNCDGGDLSPVISADGRYLYIGRYPFAGNIGHPDREDIYVSELQKDGAWGPMQNVGRPLNNEGANFLISITPDGNTVLVGNTYFPDGRPRGGGVSIAFRTEDGWTVPQEVRIDNYYNHSQYSEMSLDPSGTKLVMAVERDDSKGEKDLYVSFKKADGTFGVPQNMGSVNSWGNEISPFVAADGQTMYFATDGRKGYGGTDIWMTRRLDDTWLNWSEPENLGPVINTSGWDAYFTVPAKGDYAYLSATSAKNGSADIHRVQLSKGVKPRPVVLVKGKVLDANTKKPVTGLVNYESLTTRKNVGEARSAPKDGSYAIALPSGDLYGFLASAANYYPVSDQLDTRGLGEYAEIARDLYLVPLKTNEVIRLNNLFFDFGKAELRPESFPELDRLAAFLIQRSSIVIELTGHTDNVGSDENNLQLSKERVQAVKTYLVSQGVQEQRMKTIGYGETKPLASNASEEGRQKNRRVEFRIVNM
jgi:outer membrane protein OmpA-like peptidoglycan-associated protein